MQWRRGFMRRLFLIALLLGAWSIQANAGYSHYYTWNKPPDEAALRACISEMRLVIEAQKGILGGPEGEGQPILEAAHLIFNGIGDLAHEPFDFPGTIKRDPPFENVPDGFNGCKTLGKPYDAVVTACLLVARDHFTPDVLGIGSDGSFREGDWNDGIALYHSVLHREPKDPIAGDTISPEIQRQADDITLKVRVLNLVVAGLFVAVIVFVAKRVRWRAVN
jgi:hypothetical protein